MSGLLSQFENQVLTLTLSRTECHNAFDDHLLKSITAALQSVGNHSNIRCVVIKAEGKHFCAGADLNWMQRMAQFSESENLTDSLILANAMQSIYRCPVPTICLIQGAAMGGGAGLVAACDIAIASDNAYFCFSEAKLGLIPAVISPYVVEAVGARTAKKLFCTTEKLNAQQAFDIGLVHQVIANEELETAGDIICEQIKANAPQAVRDCKQLVDLVKNQPINSTILEKTAQLIASKRVSDEGQKGLHAFLSKSPLNWSES
ncbi:enoyl-CoA hydratase-related protein [Legionella sp. W05-934-2]|jgi:methylglutaconyl-CoA hydratase|uniref:enoyl-CoA hydratase-related protein n=1 Tax=Legionella sp. W05-934-2 TaxID=1198649 RepID=UPI0034623BB3